ncbi:PTS sugar transporter subunit IIB [[Eubacterium] hominis]|uniref:PTS sugar transporter subunit IIB n=1 Tax=[Eubacterium] hominis TaxID=2764325 RepID=UPI003A4DC70C
MKKILLACNDGMSTGYLTNKMNDYIKANGLDYEVRAIPETTIDREWENSDCILLGPQVGYMKSEIKKRIHDARPVDVINPVDYGRINAEAVVKQAIKLIEGK